MISKRIPLKKIIFGKTDAYNEVLEYGEEHFLRSFLPYNAYNISDFLDGSRYFICGGKGTGKTALLKFLECKLSENPENLVIPIRFKSDFDTEDKKNLSRSTSEKNVQEEVIEEDILAESRDSVSAWQVYLISRVLKAIDKGEYLVFGDSRAHYSMKSLVKSIYGDGSGIVFPRTTKGLVNVTFPHISAELSLDIGYEQKLEKANFRKLSKKILQYFDELDVAQNPGHVWVLFDELELSVRTKKENERDIRLVRDLIIAVGKLNDTCKRNGYPLKFLTSIRTEVIKSVISSGYEINKLVEDYGRTITWYQSGGNYYDSPLLALVEHKIRASEQQAGATNGGDLWDDYFPRRINGIECRKYILNYTWHRPRDIIRLLGLVQQEAEEDSEFFTQWMFDRALRIYSVNSWNEIVEDLSLTYSSSDIDAIKKIFSNISIPFTFGTLKRRIDELSEIYEYVKKFRDRHNLIDILERLFDGGVIGNIGQRMVFKFLGGNDLAPTEKMTIHLPLRNYFDVQTPQDDSEKYFNRQSHQDDEEKYIVD